MTSSAPHDPNLDEIKTDLKAIKNALTDAGVPGKLIEATRTRALRSARRQTGQFPSNRKSRWKLLPEDPQYGSERDCHLVLVRLLLEILQFEGAPQPNDVLQRMAAKYLGHGIVVGSFRDPLTLEGMPYEEIAKEAAEPKHGLSSIHIGHLNPRLDSRHIQSNVNWRTARSNLLQGDLTLREARVKFIELIARYFELGEVQVDPEDSPE